MPNLNEIRLMGHLARDPELRFTSNGNGVTNFTIAVNRDYGDDTDFIKCTAWNRGNYKLAEYTAKYKKGDLVFVAGELRQENWEDNNGNKRQTFKVNIDKAYNFSRKPQKKSESEPEQDDDLGEFEAPF